MAEPGSPSEQGLREAAGDGGGDDLGEMSHIMLCAGWHERREESRASAPDPLFAKRFLRACFKLLGWEPTLERRTVARLSEREVTQPVPAT